MGLEALGLALILTLGSAGGAAVTTSAWSRTREPRFLLIALGQGCLLAMGVIWAYGQIVDSPPTFARAELPIVGLAALASVMLVLGSVVPHER